MKLLAGKVAAITGGVTGIGRAIALEYVRHGACVAVNHLGDSASQEHFESLRQQVGRDGHEEDAKKRLIGIAGDIRQRATGTELVRQTVQQFGALDVFVANAGVSQFRDFLTWVLPDSCIVAPVYFLSVPKYPLPLPSLPPLSSPLPAALIDMCIHVPT